MQMLRRERTPEMDEFMRKIHSSSRFDIENVAIIVYEELMGCKDYYSWDWVLYRQWLYKKWFPKWLRKILT